MEQFKSASDRLQNVTFHRDAMRDRIAQGKAEQDRKWNEWKAGGRRDRTNANLSDEQYFADAEKNFRRQFQEHEGQLNRELADLDRQVEQASTVKKFDDFAGKARERSAQFRMAFPSIIENRMGMARSQAREQTEGAQGNVRRNFNNRGLLFSGLRQGAEADVAQDIDAGLATTRAKTQEEVNNAANALDQAAIDAGRTTAEVDMGFNQMNNEYRQSLLDAMMQRSQQQDALLTSLLGTGATAAGKAAGGLLSRGR